MAKTLNRRSIFSIIFIPFVVMVAAAFADDHAQAAPVLSYFKTEGSACSWYNWDAALPAKQKLIAKLPACPELVFFDSQQNTFYFTTGDAVYSLPLTPLASNPRFFAKLPKVNGLKTVLWNDKSNGKLRLLVISDVAERNVVRKNGKVFLREDGRLIEGSNDDIFIAGFNYAPTWESPQLVTIFELVSGEKWQRKAELATESFFGLNRAEQNWKEGATHWHGSKFNPSASIWNERGISNFSASSDLCRNETEWHCLSDISDFVAPAARASVESYFKQIKTPDLFYVSFEQVNTAIVFNTISGDTLHAVLPLLFCKNNCVQQLPLNIGARPGIEQVSLLVAFPYLLVVDDHNAIGNNPNVVDLRTGEIVFKSSGVGAMWMTAH
jgi:hypothetical protein